MNKWIYGSFLLMLSCNSSVTEDNNPDIDDVNDIPTPSDSVQDDTGEDYNEEENVESAVTNNYSFDDEDSLLYVQVYKDPNTAAVTPDEFHCMPITAPSA